MPSDGYLTNTYGGAGGIGGLLMVRLNNMNFMVGQDGSGNILNLVNMSTRSLAATFEYDAYGQLESESGPVAAHMPFRYQSKWSLRYAPTLLENPAGKAVAPRIAMDLYNYGLRWYHTDQGRFINRDPIGEAGGSNLYAFVNNDPVNKADFLGLDMMWVDMDTWRMHHRFKDEVLPVYDGPYTIGCGAGEVRVNGICMPLDRLFTDWHNDFRHMIEDSGGGDIHDTPKEKEAQGDEDLKNRCRELSNLMTRAADSHNRSSATIERNLNDLGIPVDTGFLPRIGDKVYGGATVGSAAAGFGNISGWGFAGKGLGAFATGIDVAYAYEAHQQGDTYTRSQRLKSAGVGVAALASSNPWTGVIAAIGGLGINYYEQSQMDSLNRQERDWLNQDIDRHVRIIDLAKEKIQEYGSEFNKLGCNEIDF